MPFKDTKEGSTHYFGDGCVPEHTMPKCRCASDELCVICAPEAPYEIFAAEDDILKAAQESSCLQRIQMKIWEYIGTAKDRRDAVKTAEEIFEDVKETLNSLK